VLVANTRLLLPMTRHRTARWTVARARGGDDVQSSLRHDMSPPARTVTCSSATPTTSHHSSPRHHAAVPARRQHLERAQPPRNRVPDVEWTSVSHQGAGRLTTQRV
jgi:hypothetical protein